MVSSNVVRDIFKKDDQKKDSGLIEEKTYPDNLISKIKRSSKPLNIYNRYDTSNRTEPLRSPGNTFNDPKKVSIKSLEEGLRRIDLNIQKEEQNFDRSENSNHKNLNLGTLK